MPVTLWKAFHKIHINLSLVFRLNFSAVFAIEIVFYHFISSAADIHFSWFTTPFHSWCGVHIITPYIISEFLNPNNSGYNRSCMHADSYFKYFFVFIFSLQWMLLHEVLNFYCSFYNIGCVCFVGNRQTSCTHICITNCFYFFDVVFGDNVIEGFQAGMNFWHQFSWRKFLDKTVEVVPPISVQAVPDISVEVVPL